MSKVTKKGLVVKPIIFSDMTFRAQVDVIDMQSHVYRENKWIVVYQDHITKYVQLRPVTSKRALGIAYQLGGIFCRVTTVEILSTL